MDAFSFVIALAGVALLAYQIHVSRLVRRSVLFSRGQRRAQLMLVWLLPVGGAMIVHGFVRHGVAPLPPPDHNHIPQRPNHHGR